MWILTSSNDRRLASERVRSLRASDDVLTLRGRVRSAAILVPLCRERDALASPHSLVHTCDDCRRGSGAHRRTCGFLQRSGREDRQVSPGREQEEPRGCCRERGWAARGSRADPRCLRVALEHHRSGDSCSSPPSRCWCASASLRSRADAGRLLSSVCARSRHGLGGDSVCCGKGGAGKGW